MIELFSYPFMQRALMAGVIVALLLGSLGVYIVTRRMSFIGEGVAHASLAGVAIALLFGWAPLPVALLLSVFIAIAIFFLEQKSDLTTDMAIGIMLSASLALGVLLLHFHTGYQPELMSILFGNILSVNPANLSITAAIGTVVLGLLYFFSSRLTLITIDPEGAHLAGLNTSAYLLLLYICTAVAVVLSIQIVGIILVTALLVLPSAIGRLLARTFRGFQLAALIFSVAIVVLGLILSYLLDLPSGATIILVGTIFFILVAIGTKIPFLKR